MVVGDLAHRGSVLWGRRVAFTWDGRVSDVRRARRPHGPYRRSSSAAPASAKAPAWRCCRSNQPEVVETCLAASLLGAVVVPLNPRLVAAELRFQIDDAGVTHALVHPDLAPLAEASGLGSTTAWTIGPELERAISGAEPRSWNAPRPPSDGPCIHLYTSGTTGTPKGCLLSQRGWLAANANLALSFGISADEVRARRATPSSTSPGWASCSPTSPWSARRDPGQRRRRGALAPRR